MGKGVAMIYGRSKGESAHQNTALFLISAAFLVGGVLGWLTAEKIPSTQYVQVFLETGKDGVLSSSVGRACWHVFRWPAAVCILGMLPMAGRWIPGVLCLRGFLLSYSITSFMNQGILHTVLMFGPTCILTLPVLFLLGIVMMLRKAGENTHMKPAVILACLLSLLLCVVIDQAVVPHFLV